MGEGEEAGSHCSVFISSSSSSLPQLLERVACRGGGVPAFRTVGVMAEKYVEVTEPPHPTWKPKEKQSNPFNTAPGEGMKRVAPEDLKSCYSLCISAVVPRPIAFVSTMDAQGVVNLAPFSYSGVVAHDPPTVIFSVCRKPGGVKKDTLANLESNGEFTLSFMSEWFIEAANHTCGNFPPDVDEFEESGLTPLPSERVKPPRVGESALHMECKVTHLHEITNHLGEVTATTVFGEVVLFHIHKEIYTQSGEGRVVIDLEKYKPISRLGGNTYGRTISVFDLPRPDRPATGR